LRTEAAERDERPDFQFSAWSRIFSMEKKAVAVQNFDVIRSSGDHRPTIDFV
jgi:hypothetical protein